MRGNFLIWLILWVLSLIGISFYGGVISYSIFFLLTLIPPVSLGYIICVMWQFKIYQELAGRDLVAGRAARFYLTLQNESLIPFSGLRVVFFSAFSTIYGLDDATEYELLPHTGIRRQTQLICHYRGEYEVGVRRVIIEDHLRLFRIPFNNRETFRVKVRPDIIRLESVKSAEAVLGAISERSRDDMTADVLTREYVAGDDIRLINWKVSAQAHRLMLREYTGERQRGIGIIMDTRRKSGQPEHYLPVENKLLETTIALSLYFSRKGTPVTVYYHDRSALKAVAVEDDKSFESFYEEIARVSFSGSLTMIQLGEELQGQGGLYGHRAVLIVRQAQDGAGAADSDEPLRRLVSSGVPVVTYVTGDGTYTGEHQDHPKTYNSTEQVCIPTDCRLEDVI